METIESRVEPGKVLHIVHRLADMQKPGREVTGRWDLVEPSEPLQVCCLKIPNLTPYKAHRHIPRPREITQTQEVWIVIKGIVRVTYFDLDDTLLGHRVLNAGDCTITLYGGHTYQSCTAGTTVFEVKTGPFVGVGVDKVLIGAAKPKADDDD